MSRRAGGPSLAERVAATRAAAEQRSRTVVEAPAVGKHCWVHAAPCSSGGRTAAVLVEWRQSDAGLWEGRVVYAVHLVDQISVIDTWVPSSLLEPRPGQ